MSPIATFSLRVQDVLMCLQVTVVNSRGVELCGGVLMAQSAVLTGASCLHQLNDVQPQDLYVVPGTEIHSPNSHPEVFC